MSMKIIVTVFFSDCCPFRPVSAVPLLANGIIRSQRPQGEQKSVGSSVSLGEKKDWLSIWSTYRMDYISLVTHVELHEKRADLIVRNYKLIVFCKSQHQWTSSQGITFSIKYPCSSHCYQMEIYTRRSQSFCSLASVGVRTLLSEKQALRNFHLSTDTSMYMLNVSSSQ